MSEPRIVVPEWGSDSPDLLEGWRRFWASESPPTAPGTQTLAAGWWRGYARAYALGWDECQKPDAERDDSGPFPQFSAPWEAWADGWNDNCKHESERHDQG